VDGCFFVHDAADGGLSLRSAAWIGRIGPVGQREQASRLVRDSPLRLPVKRHLLAVYDGPMALSIHSP
jgi:hypothetical protein